MRPEKRIVNQLPLTRLWNDHGDLTLERGQYVGIEHISSLLRQGSVSFAVANGGERLNWIAVEDAYRFWKKEVKPHLVEPKAVEYGFRLDDFPNEYCFTASEWTENGHTNVILLEMHH